MIYNVSGTHILPQSKRKSVAEISFEINPTFFNFSCIFSRRMKKKKNLYSCVVQPLLYLWRFIDLWCLNKICDALNKIIKQRNEKLFLNAICINDSWVNFFCCSNKHLTCILSLGGCRNTFLQDIWTWYNQVKLLHQ